MIIAGDEKDALSMSGNMLYITYIYTCINISHGFYIRYKRTLLQEIFKKTLMTVGAFLAIILVSYSMSSGTDIDLTPFTDKGLDVTEKTSKQVGAGLYTFLRIRFCCYSIYGIFLELKIYFNK